MNAPTPRNEIIDETVEASFPASDPPCWTSMHVGPPCPDRDAQEVAGVASSHRHGRSRRLEGAIRWILAKGLRARALLVRVG